MILFFGPAGSGKSVQGRLLAAERGWICFSAGQLLRDTKNDRLLHVMQKGDLVPPEMVNELVGEAIRGAASSEDIILDGYPRMLEQAKWLAANVAKYDRTIEMAVVLDVPKDELLKRLEIRGRVDDTIEAINERLHIYDQETTPILSYFEEQGIKVNYINGCGTVEQVHKRVMETLYLCKVV